MTSSDTLIQVIKSYNPNSDEARIKAAFEFGKLMHEGQFRRSGEPYFTHPVSVAEILARQQMDDDTLITALLHDTVEDTKASYSDVKERFGTEVADLVDGVTKLTNLQLTSTQTKQAENFRKLFIATSKDLRVTLVKLADRLHNMRTMSSMPPDKQLQKSHETMEIYAPLAGRMGMQWMREELEDLAFEVLEPDARISIIQRLTSMQEEAGDVIEKITHDINDALTSQGIDTLIMGRAKRPYSIWRKMREKDQPFGRLSDILGFRIVTESENDCYRALGVIHQNWRAIPGRFKDYISQPKANGYRSIQTTVSGRDARRVEVQIRTTEMHEVAESGVAAHWSYKDGARVENRFAVDPVKWISTISDRLNDDEDDHAAFLEAVKLEMYSGQVFCFTPKGDVVPLPKGATPIDFAYAIHTRIGAKTVGATVDGIRVPLWTRLQNGQSVAVVTAEGQRPQSAWLDIVVTGRAKSSIRRALRRIDREKYIRLGRELARVAFEQNGKKATDKALQTAAQTLSFPSMDDLLFQLGCADLSALEVVHTLYPNLPSQNEGTHIEQSCAVVGLTADQSYHRAECCQPIPGERIVGITFRGYGVVLHNIDCDVLGQYEDQTQRWIDLHWQEGTHQAVYTVSFDLTISNDSGVLGRVCTLIGEQGANISDLNFIERKPDYYRLIVNVDLRDTEHLHRVTTALQAEAQLASLQRLRNPKAAEYGLEEISPK